MFLNLQYNERAHDCAKTLYWRCFFTIQYRKIITICGGYHLQIRSLQRRHFSVLRKIQISLQALDIGELQWSKD